MAEFTFHEYSENKLEIIPSRIAKDCCSETEFTFSVGYSTLGCIIKSQPLYASKQQWSDFLLATNELRIRSDGVAKMVDIDHNCWIQFSKISHKHPLLFSFRLTHFPIISENSNEDSVREIEAYYSPILIGRKWNIYRCEFMITNARMKLHLFENGIKQLVNDLGPDCT